MTLDEQIENEEKACELIVRGAYTLPGLIDITVQNNLFADAVIKSQLIICLLKQKIRKLEKEIE